jgi:hypothetical protein
MADSKLSPSFDTKYSAIKQLVDSDGGLMLPKDIKDRLCLAGWLLDLKEEGLPHADRQEEFSNVMEHFEKTKRAIKFDWIWYGHFARILQYRQEYHTFTIAKNDNEHKRLRKWACRQREMEIKNKLPRARKELLIKAGFTFPRQPCNRKLTSKQERAWNEMYDMLVKFKETHGHCNARFKDNTNRKLAIWVNTQRTAYNEGKMTQYRKDRLESLGFMWSIRTQKDNVLSHHQH